MMQYSLALANYTSLVVAVVHGMILNAKTDLGKAEIVMVNAIIASAREGMAAIDDDARRKLIVWPLRRWDDDPYRKILLSNIKHMDYHLDSEKVTYDSVMFIIQGAVLDGWAMNEKVERWNKLNLIQKLWVKLRNP
ncbi:MAG: hypothetical protein WC244_01845 [Patescibacteria group bacterium]